VILDDDTTDNGEWQHHFHHPLQPINIMMIHSDNGQWNENFLSYQSVIAGNLCKQNGIQCQQLSDV